MFVCGLGREEGHGRILCSLSLLPPLSKPQSPHLDVLLAPIGSAICSFTKWFIHSTPARPLGLGPQPALEDPQSGQPAGGSRGRPGWSSIQGPISIQGRESALPPGSVVRAGSPGKMRLRWALQCK